jgi:hypothetical protein
MGLRFPPAPQCASVYLGHSRGSENARLALLAIFVMGALAIRAYDNEARRLIDGLRSARSI